MDYKILSETRNGEDDWEYTVLYTEHLVHLPFVTNEARARIKIFTEITRSGRPILPFRIVMEHDTCMLGTCCKFLLILYPLKVK